MQVAAHKSNGSDRNVLRKSHARSRISNGVDLLPNVDGRSLVARRYRDISGAIIVDQGGIDQCSESRLQLIRRFAAAAVLAIAQKDTMGRVILDVVRGTTGKADPQTVTWEYAQLLKEYGIRSVTGDAYGADWVAASWQQCGVSYVRSEQSKSELYLEAVPRSPSGRQYRATTRRRLRLPAQSESNSDIAQIFSLLYQIAFIFVEIGTSRNC